MTWQGFNGAVAARHRWSSSWKVSCHGLERTLPNQWVLHWSRAIPSESSQYGESLIRRCRQWVGIGIGIDFGWLENCHESSAICGIEFCKAFFCHAIPMRVGNWTNFGIHTRCYCAWPCIRSKDFGIPQTRTRLYFLMLRDDLPAVSAQTFDPCQWYSQYVWRSDGLTS